MESALFETQLNVSTEGKRVLSQLSLCCFIPFLFPTETEWILKSNGNDCKLQFPTNALNRLFFKAAKKQSAS